MQEPIIHGNLTCDTIFIQHNGLVKIGSVAPDAIHKNVKTFRENIKNFHFLAPEWAGKFMNVKYAFILPLIMLLNQDLLEFMYAFPYLKYLIDQSCLFSNIFH